MLRAIKRIMQANRGSIIIMAAVSIVGLFAFAFLVIDGAMMLTTRNQLQSAADAAALAGASGLAAGNQATATQRAIDFASYNEAVQDIRRPVVITAADVTFPQPDIVRVQTHRTDATGDGLVTHFMRLVRPSGDNTTDVTAVAAARYYDVCGANCIKPWAIPDRWIDTNANGVLDAGEYNPDVTGYNAPGDVGANVVLKVGNPQQSIAPGQFYPIDLPPLDCDCGVAPVTGANQYRWNIANCNQYSVEPGDRLQTENGNMVGPTSQGMQALIDADPSAYWDDAEQTVKGSVFGLSPRIALVPFFDPSSPPGPGREWVRVVKLGAFFLERVNGGQVTGRFISVTIPGQQCAVNNHNSFLKGIALVE